MAITTHESDIDLRAVSAPDVSVPSSIEPPVVRGGVDWIWGITRVCLGWIFLWPFLDKTFGLGYGTAAEDAWLEGGSPTEGFLTFGTRGPFAEFFQGFAGDLWADWIFMVGLLAIGVALMVGIGVRVAAASGTTMLILMWLAALVPEHNPLIDDHIVYAIVLVGLAAANAGDTFGFGRWWSRHDLVQRFPLLR